MTNTDQVFSSAMQDVIKKELTRYETKRSSILPILHAIQDECGWVQDKHIDTLESVYGLSRVQIKEVLTFYKAYRQEKPRKHPIQFCDNIVCCMMGAKEVMEKIQGHIDRLEKTKGEDAPFEMIGVPCLGVCDQAPAMLVNKDRHHKVTVDNVDQILSKYAPLT
jgi:NADH:ubiquinone oxidoreductase subunit E